MKGRREKEAELESSSRRTESSTLAVNPVDLRPTQPLNKSQEPGKVAAEYRAIYKKQHVTDGGILN